MKKFLLFCAALPVFCAGLQAQAPGMVRPPDDAIREPRIAERFRREYESRYKADYASVIRELSLSPDPDASALLAFLMMTDAYSLSASDAAYGLGKRLKDPAADLSALGFLKLGLGNKSGYVRFSAIMAVSGFLISPSFDKYTPEFAAGNIIPAASEILASALKDKDRDVLSAAGDLDRDIQHWYNFQSPAAAAEKRAREKREKRSETEMFLASLLMPLTILIGGIFIAFSKGGIAYLLIRPSSSLAGALHNAMHVFRRAPLLTLPPIASGTLVMGLISWVVYSALHLKGLHSGMSDHEVQNRALLMMMSPRVIAAYLAAGFAILFLNSMVIDALVHELRGQAFGFFEAFASALGRVYQIFTLSLMVFGGVYVLRILAEKLKLRLGGWLAQALELALTFTESGIMLGANYMLVIIMAESAGLKEAFDRTKELVRGGRGPALRSLVSVATISYEGAAMACLLPFIFFISLIPVALWQVDKYNWVTSKLGFPGLDDYLLFFGLGIGASLLCGTIMLSILQALEGILAVGVYFNDRGEALPGTMGPADLAHLKAGTVAA